MSQEEQIVLKKEELSAVIQELLTKVGVPAADAAITADVMADTNARGVESHGVRWLDIYLQRIQAGGVSPVTKLDVVQDKPSLLILDANNGLGQVAMHRAVEMGAKKAKENGVAIVGLRNTNHFGACAYYTEMASKMGLVSFVCTNATPLMAPWGGIDLCIGTNPLSYGFPTKGTPIILDMATTAYARGKVFVAERKGEKIPEGVALDKNGAPTTDPKAALEGIMLPASGPKGFGLSLVIDLLCGIMTGAKYGTHITPIFGTIDKSQNIGHFAFFLDIEAFVPVEEYYNNIEDNIANMKKSRLAKGYDRIYMPGEIESGIREKNLKDGISIPKPTWDVLQEWKAKLA
ncbi:putative oxidoreductase YjmC [Pseudodesulfovibrio hydrargyri]|uniref:Putative oxidoreductase YjmC n=1 Tax=Pseudodesulfovibrio hydrargyri TaxID=2125990 RepID=A0A1J5N4I2_9BACT|nr:Ldh family oxidoreductase [Pseudodesulfovibrio hydrargyri]OIQ50523.1 putative oxidoreductase YjmC [Pseudodesulfovibrio hydrargyri]